MDYNYLKYEIKERVAYIILNRPSKSNAFSYDLVKELKQAFATAQNDEEVKIVVLAAEGNVFCAGADLDYLRSLQGYSYETNLEDSMYLKELYWQIYQMPKIVIACVQGHALAGGCGLVTVADFVFSVPEAKFAYTEVKIGFIPAIVMTFLLRKIGEAKAKNMLLSGNTITAEVAKDYGIVNEIVSSQDLKDRVHHFAKTLIENNSSQAMGATKQMIAEVQEMKLTDALNYAAEMNAKARGSEDCKKGISAFLNKEKIKW
jgi:methylglutaconyl-CoA hydratase